MNGLPPDSPQAWLRRARSDIALARVAVDTPHVLLEDVCFHAQQCAEKALKAVLLQRGIGFPRTHAVEVLLDLLIAAEIQVPEDVDEAVVLSQYAVQTRYPGHWEPVTWDEAQAAVALASSVLRWAEGLLR